MEWSEKFESAFNTLIKTIQTGNLDSLLTINDLYIDLGSISTIEKFYNPQRLIFSGQSCDHKMKLLQILTDIDNMHFENRERNWYYANLFNIIFMTVYSDLDENSQIEILNYILQNRRNERIPFAKDLELKFTNFELFNEAPLKKFKQFQHKWKDL
jgi:hypothetical protein